MSYEQSFIIFLIMSICSVASWILGYRSYRMASRYKRELDILKGHYSLENILKNPTISPMDDKQTTTKAKDCDERSATKP